MALRVNEMDCVEVCHSLGYLWFSISCFLYLGFFSGIFFIFELNGAYLTVQNVLYTEIRKFIAKNCSDKSNGFQMDLVLGKQPILLILESDNGTFDLNH